MILNSGKEFTYNTLAVSMGFDHKIDSIEGLKDYENEVGGHLDYKNVWFNVIDDR